MLNKILVWILSRSNGYKSIVAWLLLQIPWLSGQPMLIAAIEAWIADPQNPQKIGELILQILLAIGIIHHTVKVVKAAEK